MAAARAASRLVVHVESRVSAAPVCRVMVHVVAMVVGFSTAPRPQQCGWLLQRCCCRLGHLESRTRRRRRCHRSSNVPPRRPSAKPGARRHHRYFSDAFFWAGGYASVRLGIVGVVGDCVRRCARLTPSLAGASRFKRGSRRWMAGPRPSLMRQCGRNLACVIAACRD